MIIRARIKPAIAILYTMVFVAALSAQSKEPPSAALPAPDWAYSTPAENRSWTFDIHPYDEKAARNEISSKIKMGFFPTGIEVVPGSAIYVTYSRNAAVRSNDWALFTIDAVEKVNPEVQSLVKQGWTPIDIAFTEKVIYVLALKGPTTVKEWRIFQSPARDIQGLQNDIKSYSALGFQSVGITQFDNKIWTLAVKEDTSLFTVGELKGYKNDGESLIGGLQYEASQGFAPMGFSVSKDLILVLFSK